MATKEEFKASVQRLKDLQASRKESGAQARAEIQALLDKGDTRGAYRRFEELPILDQLAISLTPSLILDSYCFFILSDNSFRAC